MAPGQPLWSNKFIPFHLAQAPDVFFDSIDKRVASEDPNAVLPPGVARVELSHFCHPPEQFEAMLIEPDGTVYIWTTTYVGWLERDFGERFRSIMRDPPRGLW
jgi:hypothetical protein